MKSLDNLLLNISTKIARRKIGRQLEEIAFRALSRMNICHAHYIPLSDRAKDGIYGFLEKYMPQVYLDKGFERAYEASEGY